ncbi:MAG: hypothetical protein WCK18_10005 [Prolixibacteraceae bacterium]
MKIALIRIEILLILICFSQTVKCQGFSADKISLSNFIKRMYNTSPFEGVKIVDDYDHKYLISVLSLEKAKYTSATAMNRVAQVKGQRQASTFLNGSTITSELVIKTTEKKEDTNLSSIIETIESIKENSIGFVNEIELLQNFDSDDGKQMVFIYYKELKEKK